MALVQSLLEKMRLVHTPAEDTAPVEEPNAAPIPASRAAPAAPEPAAEPRVVRISAARFAEGIEPEAGPNEFPFDKVYEKAGIVVPEHGFTVYKLLEMVEAEEMKVLEPEARARVLTAMLQRLPGGPVAVEEIARDAGLRDQALDGFEAFLASRLEQAEAEAAEKNAALQEEVDRVARANEAAIAANQAAVEEQRAQLERWRARKEAEERRLHDAIAPFVGENPVTRPDPAEEI